MIRTIVKNVAMWTGGIARLGFPQVFPCLEFVIVCAKNYDENRKAIVNQNT